MSFLTALHSKGESALATADRMRAAAEALLNAASETDQVAVETMMALAECALEE